MTTIYNTIKDVVEKYVRPTLGDWAKFYNLEDIAYEITHYRTIRDEDCIRLDRSFLVLKDVHDPDSEFFDADMFWDVAECNRIAAKYTLEERRHIVNGKMVNSLTSFLSVSELMGITHALNDDSIQNLTSFNNQFGFEFPINGDVIARIV